MDERDKSAKTNVNYRHRNVSFSKDPRLTERSRINEGDTVDYEKLHSDQDQRHNEPNKH